MRILIKPLYTAQVLINLWSRSYPEKWPLHIVGDRNHFPTLDVNPHSGFRRRVYESRNKRKREVRCGKRSRAPLLRGGVLHVEEERPKSWRSTRNFPALVTLLRVSRRVGRTTKIPLGRPLRLGNMTGVRHPPRNEGLADHITVPRAIFVFTRHTSGRPKWLAIHAPMEGFETRDRAVTQA